MANEFQAVFSIENATQTDNGLMSKEDKTKLDGLSGDVAIDLATQTTDGLMSKEDKTKLDGISGEAIGNATQIADGLMSKEDKTVLDSLSLHPQELVKSEEGVHGIRYFQGKLQCFDGETWITVGGGASSGYRTMGVRIDFSDSDPQTCITYTDDAAEMEPESAAWDEFFGYKPCLFQNGAVVGYLNKENYAQFEDGTPVDNTSGTAGDIMVEFPRRGLKIEKEGDILTIKVTDDPENAAFDYYAHQRVQERREAFYLGAYKGSLIEDKLYSLSGKTPTAPIGIDEARMKAQSKGEGYELGGYYQLIYLQCMYLMKYRNLNSQMALGRGFVDGNSATTLTGGTDTKGIHFGEPTGKYQMKLFGVEDVWGNILEYIDGVRTDDAHNILTSGGNFSDTDDGYINNGNGGFDGTVEGGYGTVANGTSKTGFIPVEFGGTATTYFCDSVVFQKRGIGRFGGHWRSGDAAGIFHIRIYPKDSADPMVGTRIMYL